LIKANVLKGKARFLSLKEERDLIHKWQSCKDETALRQLLISYYPFIVKMARIHSHTSERQADLVNDGIITMIEIINRFQPRGDAKLSSYARNFIRASMLDVQHKMDCVIEIPRQSLIAAKKKNTKEVDSDIVQAMARKISLGDMQDEIAAPEEFSPLELVSKKQTISSWKASLQSALDELPEEERKIMAFKLASEDEKAKDIAQKFGISTSRARALESRAMMRLKSLLLSRGFDISQLAAA
jgi:RNA polymerase sigma factor (sigma-70 family)